MLAELKETLQEQNITLSVADEVKENWLNLAITLHSVLDHSAEQFKNSLKIELQIYC